MALNSRQKRARKRKLALALLAKSRNPPMVASEGRVRSTAQKRMLILPAPRGFTTEGKQKPTDTTWEGKGTRGRSVAGKVVRPKGPRFDANPKGPIDVDAASSPRVFSDTLRLKAAKSQMYKRNQD